MAKDTKNKVKSEKKERTFFKDFKAELKKVTWPTVKQLAQKTAVVIVIVLIIAAIVFVLDNVFSRGYQFVVNEAAKVVHHEDKNTNETNNEANNEVNNETKNEVNNETQNTTTDNSANTTEGNETSPENTTNNEVTAE